MTKVADDNTNLRIALGDLTVQQWELFRRVKEGTLKPEVILRGLQALTFSQEVIAVEVVSKYGGFKIRISRSILELYAKMFKGDGGRVRQMSVGRAEWDRVRDEDKTIFDLTNTRPATWTEAINFIACNKAERKKWGLIAVMGTSLNISFEEWDSEITIVIAEGNWQFLSRWEDYECKLLVTEKSE